MVASELTEAMKKESPEDNGNITERAVLRSTVSATENDITLGSLQRAGRWSGRVSIELV